MLLHKFEGNFTRERFLDMDDWEMMNVLCRPNTFGEHDKSGRYWPIARMEDPNDPVVGALDHRGVFFHPDRIKAMKALGFTDAEIEERYESYARGKASSSYR